MSLQAYTPYTYSRGFNSGEYHHAVLSISGTTHTLYLDGSAVIINTGQPNIFTSFTTITNTIIGAQQNLTQAFRGSIGDVRIFNYAISATQVSSLYINRNLVVHYPFDSSVNSMTPNYGTMIYDASFNGGANTIVPGFVGKAALTVSNTAGAKATQYITSNPGIPNGAVWNLNATRGLTVSFWVNTAGVASRIQRLFDIPTAPNIKGLSVDISGTNMIYSSWIMPAVVSSGIKIPPITTYAVNTNFNSGITPQLAWTRTNLLNYYTNISSSSYPILNGTYYCTASSSSGDTNLAGYQQNIFNIFDGVYATNAGDYYGNNNAWLSLFGITSNYNAASPYNAISGVSTTNINGNVYSNSTVFGQWIQLQTPNAVIIKGFTIYYPSLNISGIRGALLVGSTNGTTWNYLTNFSTPASPGSSESYSFGNSTAYSYYRLIATNANFSGKADCVAITELVFNT